MLLKRLKKSGLIILSISFMLSVTLNTFGNDDNNDSFERYEEENFFLGLDEDGNIINMYDESDDKEVVEEVIDRPAAFSMRKTFDVVDMDDLSTVETFSALDDASEYLDDQPISANLSVMQGNKVVDVKYGVVNFRTKSSTNNTDYIEEATGKSGYTNGTYAGDGAFLGYDDKGRVRFKLAGVVGLVDKKEVQIVDYNDTKTVSKYYTKNGRLYHGIVKDINLSGYASTQDVGVMPSYLQDGKNYYSYDGHYFYTSFARMIDDYKANRVSGSVNANNPYYNYYQFLSHRTISTVTAESLDKYVKAKKPNAKSKLYDLGKYFKEYEKDYGINALLMYGVAINESAWGTSTIAQTKNNLFGHNAYDSSPGDSASGYPTPQYSVYHHASSFISNGYLNANDWRHRGPHLGDNGSGVNYKYASDPYWGEKAAAHANIMEKEGYFTRDQKTKIGVINTVSSINIRKEPNTSSKIVYRSGTTENNAVKIIGEVKGTSVGGNTTWYKIQSDSLLSENRENIIVNPKNNPHKYDMDKMYVYIHSSFVDIINVPSNPKPVETRLRGDISGKDGKPDGKIDGFDMMAIKRHHLGVKKLSGLDFRAADITGKDGKPDGVVDGFDMMDVKRHHLGIKKLDGVVK